MRLFLIFIVTIIGVALVFYLSWLPQPKLGLNWFIPKWLATWADAHKNETVRTGVPFILLGIVISIYLLLLKSNWFSWLASWLVLSIVVLLAEIGQLYLPHRSFDWWDVCWGSAGAMFGLVVSFSIVRVGSFLKSIF